MQCCSVLSSNKLLQCFAIRTVFFHILMHTMPHTQCELRAKIKINTPLQTVWPVAIRFSMQKFDWSQQQANARLPTDTILNGWHFYHFFFHEYPNKSKSKDISKVKVIACRSINIFEYKIKEVDHGCTIFLVLILWMSSF